MPALKLTDEVAADIRARVKSLDFGAIEKIKKAKDDNGTFDVIISTEDLDRSGEIVRQNGWEMTNYKNNPIVLFAHDYYSLPIGVCLETYKTEVHGVPATGAKGVFYPADINPLAQQVRRMYDFGVKNGVGVGCTTSVGFIPKEFDEDNQRIITRAELLEFSFVPVPANQGVGPAQGRAFTFDEAKELGLDVPALRVKGLEFVEGEKVAPEADKKEAQAGDDCTMDDGTPGQLTTDPKDRDGALVCVPHDQDKSAVAGRASQKALLKSVDDEHERHSGDVDKCFDAFQKAVVEDQGDLEDPNEADDGKKKAKRDGKSEDMRRNLKDLRSALADEHTMHRAKSVATFRSFDPSEDKAFDKNPHLKALRGEHDEYETKNNKALDSFEEKCMKSVQGAPGETDEHTDWITGKMETNQNVHKKAVVKIAKAMCKAAFGEEDQADEKTLEILKEYLAPHIDAQLLPAVAAKIGARMSAESKKKLGEAHEHLKAATAVVEALHGGLGDSGGEEGHSDDDDKSATPAPGKKRSRPVGDASAKDELNDHLFARDVLREITTVATSGLEKINRDRKARA